MSFNAPKNWQVTTMQEAIDWFSSGEAFLKMEYSNEGVPVLSKGDIKPFGRLVHSEKRYIPRSLATARGYRTTREGDYLLTTRDLTQAADFLGLLARIPSDREYLINQGANIVRFKPGVNGRFMVYWCNGPIYRAYIKGHCVGSTQIHIRKGDFLGAPLWLPSDGEQEKIVNILGSLDDRIDLLRETNTTLEAITQALFKSWFVDFDPVHAKTHGRSPEGMDEATADLFPDGFEDSELGPVPKGWLIGTIDTLARLNPESWSAKQHPDRIHYIDLANTKDGQIDGINEFSFEDAPSRARRVLRYGDVIVGTVRPGNRSFARITTEQPGLTGSTGFAVLRAQEEFDQALVYIAATSDEAIDRLAHLADGGAYPAVRPEVVSSTPLIVAPESIRKAFGEIANTFYLNIGVNQERMRQLSLIRDTLLPRLISGQLQTEEAHQSLQEVES